MKTFVTLMLAASSLMSLTATAGEVRWETSLPAAQARAQKEGKPIFMDVWTDWCGWCTKLRTSTFPTPEAQAALAGVVPLSLRTQDLQGKSTDEFGVQAKYKVEAYPMLIMLNADGTERARNAGYLPPTQFAAWVRQHAK
jgi:thiol:disulfide interchange protein